MIKGSILVTALLLALYTIYLVKYTPKTVIGQHQWQNNYIKAQHYLFDKNKTPENVIVGSSLSFRLINDILSNGFGNLSFGGLSIFEGLGIILRRNELPKRVFIEMNLIKRDPDGNFIHRLCQPILFAMGKQLAFLHEENQPAVRFVSPMVNSAGKNFIDPFVYRFFNPAFNKLHKKKEPAASNDKEDFYTGQVNQNAKGFEHPLKKEDIATRFLLLKKYVKLLESKGVAVIFFEMPMHPLIENSSQLLQLRGAVAAYFPGNTHLPTPAYNAYVTTDGLHLGGDDALRYTLFFRENAQRIINIKE